MTSTMAAPWAPGDPAFADLETKRAALERFAEDVIWTVSTPDRTVADSPRPRSRGPGLPIPGARLGDGRDGLQPGGQPGVGHVLVDHPARQ